MYTLTLTPPPGIRTFELHSANESGLVLLRTLTLGVGLTASNTDTTFDKAPVLALVTDDFTIGSVSADALHIRSTGSVDGETKIVREYAQGRTYVHVRA